MTQSILSKGAHTIFVSLIALSLLSCGGDELSPTGGGEATLYDVSVSVTPSGAGSIAPRPTTLMRPEKPLACKPR